MTTQTGFFSQTHNPNPSTSSVDYPLQTGSPSTLSPRLAMSKLPNGGSSGSLNSRPFRTPSPTPSDIEELRKGVIDWQNLFNWRNWAKRKYIGYYIAIILSTVLVVLISIYHKQIVETLTPASQYLKNLNGGWAIPIAIMFVLSFPPLFGNEIVHVLCGIVWGLWIGFGIVCAGTFLGEVGNFYAFRYCCQTRGNKLEKNSIVYATLAKVVRDGGFLVAVIVRLSVVPGHFTTAVFSTCGMGIVSFCLGAFLSLPKQFATVYIGVALYQASGVESTQQKIVSGVVLTLTIGVTFFAGWWILKKMAIAKPLVLEERRRARAISSYNNSKTYLTDAASDVESSEYHAPGASTLAPQYNPNAPPDFNTPYNYSGSTVNLPLSVKPQRWDANGRAILDTDFTNNAGAGYNNNNWAQRQLPPGAGPAAIPGPLAASAAQPPDIRVTRASGASSIQGGPESLFVNTAQRQQQEQYDVPLDTPTQQRYQPGGRVSDDSSGEHQWATREDEREIKMPLTADIHKPNALSAAAESSPVTPIGIASAPPGQDYDDLDLYNPYDAAAVAKPAGGQHRWEETDGSAGSFHTASPGGSSGYPSPRQQPQQYPPASGGPAYGQYR